MLPTLLALTDDALTGQDVLKAMRAGARVGTMTSALLQREIGHPGPAAPRRAGLNGIPRVRVQRTHAGKHELSVDAGALGVRARQLRDGAELVRDEDAAILTQRS